MTTPAPATNPLMAWIDKHAGAAAQTIGQFIPRVEKFLGGIHPDDLTPDDLTIKDFGFEVSPSRQDVQYLWFDVSEIEGGKRYDEYRIINMLQLHAIPLDARGDTGAVDKMRKVLRGLANANLDLVYLTAGIFHPLRLGIVQCYGVIAHGPNKEQAILDAARGAAALEAGMAASYPQIRFRPLDRVTGQWINDALIQMPYSILTVGQPDPRENARGLGTDINPILNGSKGKQVQYTMQQNEIVMRGMAQLEEDFMLQVLLTPVTMTQAAKMLHGLMEYTSTVASWQTGTRSFNLGTSLPILFSGAMTRSAGEGSVQSESHGVADGVSHVDSSSHMTGRAHTVSNSVAVSDGIAETHAEGQSHTTSRSQSYSVTDGVSSGESHSRGESANFNAGISLGVNAGASGGASYQDGVSSEQSHSQSFSTSSMESDTQSSMDSVTRSHSVTTSRGEAETTSEADTTGVADGTSRTESQQSGTALARTVGQGWSDGLSYGLAPSASISEANQWQNDPAIMLTQILRQQQVLLNTMTLEAGFYADVYALTATERGKQALLTLIPEAFHGTENIITGVQTRTLHPKEEAYIRLHAKAMVPSMRECRLPEAMSAYMDTTLLTAEQSAAYMTPGLMEEGAARTVQEAIPPFAYDPMMPGDVCVGHQYTSERGVKTSTPLNISRDRHFHTAFVADTGFGKSVAAERLAYETTLKWHYRTIVLDFGQGWRKAMNWPGLDLRVDIRQLYPGAVRPIRWNPLQIPKRSPAYRYRNMLVELFANAGRMGPRQLGFMRDALTSVYNSCGVIVDGSNEGEWGMVRDDSEEMAIRAGVNEAGGTPRDVLNFRLSQLTEMERQALFIFRSRNASILSWVERLKALQIEAERARDQNSRSSLEGVLLRLQPLAEGELLNMYGPGSDTIAIEDLGLLGPANDKWGIAVIEGGAQMDEFAKSALLSLIAAILYEDAVVRRREMLGGQRFPPMQIFFEEANKVLTGVTAGSAASDKDAGSGGNQTAQIFTVMWRDGRKYQVFLHILAQTISEIPEGILSSCNNGFFGQTKNDEDRKAVLAHLARSNKGFVNSEYDRFVARMVIGMFIAKLGYTTEVTQTEPFLIEPAILKADEPSDREIYAYFSAAHVIGNL